MSVTVDKVTPILKDIEQTFGVVPSFLKELRFDAETLEAEWRLLKKYSTEETHIPGKYRELIGLAVASAIHCRFCITAHSEFARLGGATEDELKEAAYLAKYTAGWSAFADGRLQDTDVLKRELAQVREHMAKQAGPGPITMMAEGEASPHTDKMRRLVEEVFNKGTMKVADELIAPDIVDHHAFPGQEPGREGFKRGIQAFRAAFPDMKWTIETLFGQGDKVAVQGSMTGTHRGAFMGIPPTGKPVSMTGTNIVRFSKDQIVEHWGLFDVIELMGQLGAAPGWQPQAR